MPIDLGIADLGADGVIGGGDDVPYTVTALVTGNAHTCALLDDATS